MTSTLSPAAASLELTAARASTFDDRLSGRCEISPETDGDVIAQRLAHWRAVVAGPQPQQFDKRLEWDGIGPAEQAVLLSDTPMASAGTRPDWVATLYDIYGETEPSLRADVGGDRVLRVESPQPFAALFIPAVRYARSRVLENSPWTHEALSPDSLMHLEWGLHGRLAQMCQRALFASFSALRATMRSQGVTPTLAGPEIPRVLYQQFIEAHLDGGMMEFFAEYPVAGRLVATAVHQWIVATGEIIDRITADRELLQRHYGGETPLGAVVRLKSDSGDTHDGGRAVGILEFTNGVRIVYKPRSVELDTVWSDVVAWFNRRRPDGLELRSAEAIARPGYGWVEFINTTPCANDGEVADYYERSGEVLGLVHALAGNDYHLENIIAAGAHPVLIDHEALLTPRGVVLAPGDTRAVGLHNMSMATTLDSVGTTGLMPLMRQRGEIMVDMGGLASADNLDIKIMYLQWRHINSDLMRMSTLDAERTSPTHVPTVDGAPQFAAAHVENIVRGFERAYRVVLAHRDELRACLAAAVDAPVRVLCRNTSLYFSILLRCQHPQFLRSGWRRAVEIDVLTRPFLAATERPSTWTLIADERRSMEQGDIPLFATAAGSRDLPLGDGTIVENFFERSAVEQSNHRIDSLDDAKLADQLDYIYASFASAAARGVGQLVQTVPRELPANVSPLWSREDAVAEAIAIAGEIEARAARSSEHAGLRVWRGIQYSAAPGRYTVRAVGPTLYDGYIGTALLHAALYRATGDAVHEANATSLLDLFVPDLCATPKAFTLGRFGLGLADVHGGGVYGLASIASLLGGRADVLDGARAMAGLVRDGLGKDEWRVGVMQGTAGAALALLKLHAVSGDEAVLADALSCADTILAALKKYHPYVLSGVAPPAGQNRVGRGGVARGPAGIALALLRLDAHQSRPELRDAADALLACDAVLRATAVNEGEGPRVASAWAEGESGIAIAHLGAQHGSAGAAVRSDIVERLRGAPLEAADDLNNGAMGTIDTLLTVGQTLGDDGLVSDARRRAAAVLWRRGQSARYETGWGDRITNIGLYPGLAGIAYEYLRIAEPDAIPSLLTLN